MIDTHVNFHAEAFKGEREAMLARAREAGVDGFLAICDRIDRDDLIGDLVAPIADMWRSLGVHPHHARDFPKLDAERLIALASGDKVCALGETGLDYHYCHSPKEEQIRCFEAHIDAAQSGLPLVIHCRDADDDMGDLLERHMAHRNFVPLMHSFTGSERLARRASEMGAYFSVNGIISFRNAEAVCAVVRTLPLDRIVLETDCPYLAPIPYRGRRNEPAFLVRVCEELGAVLGRPPADIDRITSAAACALFPRAFH